MGRSCDICPGVQCDDAQFFQVKVAGRTIIPGLSGREATVDGPEGSHVTLVIHGEPIENCPALADSALQEHMAAALERDALVLYYALVSLGMASPSSY